MRPFFCKVQASDKQEVLTFFKGAGRISFFKKMNKGKNKQRIGGQRIQDFKRIIEIIGRLFLARVYRIVEVCAIILASSEIKRILEGGEKVFWAYGWSGEKVYKYLKNSALVSSDVSCNLDPKLLYKVPQSHVLMTQMPQLTYANRTV